MLKFGVWLQTNYARAHVRTSFSYLEIHWTHRVEIWCAVGPINYTFYTGHKWGIAGAQVQLNIRVCRKVVVNDKNHICRNALVAFCAFCMCE